MPHNQHFNRPPVASPEIIRQMPSVVAGLLEQGYMSVNPLFNVTIDNRDGNQRYDIIDPVNEDRLLWTPPSDHESMELIEKTVGSLDHPVFFPLVRADEQGELRALPASVRLLANTLGASPYIPEYTHRLQTRAEEFMSKLNILDSKRFGLDTNDLVINHNGAEDDDVFFSVVTPVQRSTDLEFASSEAYVATKKSQIQQYVKGLK